MPQRLSDDQLFYAPPDVILNALKEDPSWRIYTIGREALKEMMQAQMTAYGAQSVALHLGEFETIYEEAHKNND